ncbi:MAG: response regulator [Lachnospiraceae bacterium]|nr:response regulator [Lachnospiraceae bacterium]
MLQLLTIHQLDIMLALSSICGMTTFFVFLSDSLTRGRKQALMTVEIGGMLLLVSDMLTYIYAGDMSTFGYWMVRVSNYLTFALMPILMCGFTYYIQDLLMNEGGLTIIPRRMKAVYYLTVISEVLIAVNLYGRYYYYIDEYNLYHRSWAFILCYVMPLLVLVILLTIIRQYRDRINKNIRISLILFTITPVIGSLIQFFALGLSITDIFIVGTCVMLYVFVLIDMNQAKKEKEAAEEMSVRAVAASEAKSAFLSNMSHEIRTPINAILGMNEMILRECDDSNILGYSETIRTAGSTLLGLVNDILDFSKIEAGKMEIIPVEYDLSSVLNDLVNMIQTRADAKGLILKLKFDQDVPKILNGDEVRLKQVITNILTNAVKYTEKGSITFHVGYDRTDDDPDSIMLNVSVKDTGMGIKPEDMKKMFSEFERIEEGRNRNIEGTGLGMNITKRLLEMMGTSLKVDSVYGEGSDFSFALRQKVVKWNPLGDYEASYRASLSERKKYREKFTAPEACVLVVDDTETNLTVFKSLLKRTKVSIDTAASGDECLALTHDKRYDMIFLDHMMPQKDGIQTFHELHMQQDNPNLDTPTICLTANAISGAREKYLAEGFNDYLAKPIDAERLEAMLIEYLPKDKVVLSSAKEGDEPKNELEEALPDWLTDCEGIDASAGVINCGGTEEYLTVLSGFYASIDAKADEIENYYDSGDIRNYTIKVHALKSSARIIGATELSEEARLLEDAGNAENMEYINGHTADLLSRYRAYKDILKPISESTDDLPDIPGDMLADAYAGLSEFAEAMDYELARMVMDSVKEYKLPKEDDERFKRLQTCLSQLDWDGIKEIVGETVK